MALRLIYQVFINLLGWIVLSTRSDTAKDIEILVLRHQLAVLQRRTPRPVAVARDLDLEDGADRGRATAQRSTSSRWSTTPCPTSADVAVEFAKAGGDDGAEGLAHVRHLRLTPRGAGPRYEEHRVVISGTHRPEQARATPLQAGINRLTRNRAVATHFDRLAVRYLATVRIAALA
jgi:hypothetical protein